MDKYKKLASNTVIFAIGTFSSKLLSVLMLRFYVEYLSSDEYSTMNMIVQTANILIPIATLCMTDGIIRFALDKGFQRGKVFTNGVLVALLGVTAVTITYPILSMFNMLDGYVYFVYIYVLTSTLRALSSYFVRARGLSKLFAYDGVQTTFVTIALTILFMAVFKLGVHGYMLAVILADAISAIFLTFIASNHKYLKKTFVDKKVIKQMVAYCLPLIPSSILWWLISTSDLYIVDHFKGGTESGIYAAAYKIPTMISIVSSFFMQAWQVSAISESDKNDKAKFYSTVFNSYKSFMFVSAAGLIMVLYPIMLLLVKSETNPEYMDGYSYTPILIISSLMASSCLFLSNIYQALKKTKNSFFTSLIAAIVNIVLNIVLIPTFGAVGAAIATAFSYFTCFVVRLIDTQRYVKFKYRPSHIVVNLVVLIGMSFMVYYNVPLKMLWIVLCFVGIFCMNIRELLKFAKKILSRR